jgi:hypothetical protein
MPQYLGKSQSQYLIWLPGINFNYTRKSKCLIQLKIHLFLNGMAEYQLVEGNYLLLS